MKSVSKRIHSDRSRILFNKKVLLRERKRHTARRVASTRCAALSNPDLVRLGGYPVPGPRGTHTWGVPSPRSRGGTWSKVWGVPGPRSLGGIQSQVWGGTPSRPGQGVLWVPPYLDLGWGTPHLDLGWGTPHLGWGTPLPGMGYPPYLDLGWGTPPPPPPQVWTD